MGAPMGAAELLPVCGPVLAREVGNGRESVAPSPASWGSWSIPKPAPTRVRGWAYTPRVPHPGLAVDPALSLGSV